MIKGPWYITVRAVRDYLALTGRPDATDGADFEAAESELIEMARATIASGRQPARLDSGALRYRGPSPRRLQLIVVPSPRAEGTLPQLVRVLPAFDVSRRRG